MLSAEILTLSRLPPRTHLTPLPEHFLEPHYTPLAIQRERLLCFYTEMLDRISLELTTYSYSRDSEIVFNSLPPQVFSAAAFSLQCLSSIRGSWAAAW